MLYFATIEHESVQMAAVAADPVEGWLPVGQYLTGINNMYDLIEKFYLYEEDILALMKNKKLLLEKEITMKAPFVIPRRPVVCLGKNYSEHVHEIASVTDASLLPPVSPIYFGKMARMAAGDKEDLSIDDEVANMLDYEVELAVVIGRKGKNILTCEADNYIFGYTIVNDITARDLQKKHIQWFKGKSIDGALAIGPWIVKNDTTINAGALKIQSKINGEIRQNDNTSSMIFDIPSIISDFSRGTTLFPGDIISTGTPAGVGMGFTPPKFLSKGDLVECYIEKIGWLRNKIC